MSQLHDPGNERAIDELFVFMTIDANGRHGICAHIMPGLGSTPLVTGSPKAARLMKAMAREVAKLSGKRVGMFRFTRAELMEEL